jgi:hypothetical protein
MDLETLNKNNFMEWQKINTSIYYKDGSLRDIYIYNTTIHDWKKWIDYVNEKFKIIFHNRSNDITSDKIDIKDVIKYWRKENEYGVFASIDVYGIKLMCYFNLKNEIETDFAPNEIKDVDDHNNLINYLKTVSTILQKPVIVTAEMKEDEILLTVINEDIYYPSRIS